MSVPSRSDTTALISGFFDAAIEADAGEERKWTDLPFRGLFIAMRLLSWLGWGVGGVRAPILPPPGRPSLSLCIPQKHSHTQHNTRARTHTHTHTH